MNYFERAKKYRAKKRLGQNFLTDAVAIESILDAADITSEDVVVEIGPGLGFMTENLVRCAKKVYAVELDEDMVREVSKINADNLEIIHADILKTDISAFGNNLKIVANIPYYITSPILSHLLGEIDDIDNKNRNSISKIILTVQYEVGKRLVANEKSPSKEYGPLTFLAQFYADVEFVRKIGARSFFPAPKVDSAVVKLDVRKEPLIKLSDYSFFKKVIRGCFASRRKNIKNSLVNAGFALNSVKKTLEELNIDENLRGESLSIFEIAKLSEKLKENL